MMSNSVQEGVQESFNRRLIEKEGSNPAGFSGWLLRSPKGRNPLRGVHIPQKAPLTGVTSRGLRIPIDSVRSNKMDWTTPVFPDHDIYHPILPTARH